LTEDLSEVKYRTIFENMGTRTEEAYRALVEGSLQGLLIIQDFRVVFANEAAARLSGYTVEEMMSLSPDKIRAAVHPDDRGPIWNQLRDRLEGKPVPSRYELRIIHKDGTVHWLDVFSNLIEYRGKPALQVTFLDITERIRAQEALRESEERYRSFLRNLQGIAYRGNMDWTPIFFHGAVEKITGYTEKEFTAGKPRWNQIIYPEDLPRISESKVASTPNYSEERKYRIVRKDGEIRWVHEVIQNICDDSGKPIMVQGTIYDITEHKEAEDEIKSLARFPEENPNPVMRLSQDGVVLDANKASERLLQDWGCKAGGKAPKYWRDLVNELYTSQSSRSVDVELGDRTFLFTLVPVKDTGYVNIYGRDITDRKQAQQALRESEEKYRAIVENSPNLVTIIQEGSLKYVNSAACKRTGWTFED